MPHSGEKGRWGRGAKLDIVGDVFPEIIREQGEVEEGSCPRLVHTRRCIEPTVVAAHAREHPRASPRRSSIRKHAGHRNSAQAKQFHGAINS